MTLGKGFCTTLALSFPFHKIPSATSCIIILSHCRFLVTVSAGEFSATRLGMEKKIKMPCEDVAYASKSLNPDLLPDVA